MTVPRAVAGTLRFLPGVIGRIPASVHVKLLAAFLFIVALFIGIGLIGLQVLGSANDRAQELGNIEKKVAAIHGLLTGINADLARAASSFATSDETTIEEVRRQLGQSSYDFDRLRFVAPDEAALIDEIEPEHERFLDLLIDMVTMLRDDDRDGALDLMVEADASAETLRRKANALVVRAESDAASAIDDNNEQYAASLRFFIGFATAGVVLALLLGYGIAWSVIRPVREMDGRMARVAAGDFSGHANVNNRDELGALAANLNRMNDELGRLYTELETASRHKSEFLANMSHELRTPLNAIIGFSEVLSEHMFGELNEKQDEYVADILGSGRHLLSLINDILDLSKVEAGRMELDVESFVLTDALENGISMVRERAARRGVTLGLKVDPAVGLVEADERKVKQVVYNLLTNAVKFTSAGGTVDVSARALPGAVEIAVRDTGIGIAPEEQATIFEEFRQASRPTGVEREGTGLGLALAKRFVELHGGQIRVESVPGQGSTFAFTIPHGSVALPQSLDGQAPMAAEPRAEERPTRLMEDPYVR
jgi:signal transduction histidine kinase